MEDAWTKQFRFIKHNSKVSCVKCACAQVRVCARPYSRLISRRKGRIFASALVLSKLDPEYVATRHYIDSITVTMLYAYVLQETTSTLIVSLLTGL